MSQKNGEINRESAGIKQFRPTSLLFLKDASYFFMRFLKTIIKNPHLLMIRFTAPTIPAVFHESRTSTTESPLILL
jgi:hypothetical protein